MATRRAFAGGAVQTTITAGINSTALSIGLTASSGWPTGHPFFVVIDAGQPNEEKVLVTRSGSTLTAADTSARGVDGTAASSHASGATIYPCVTATDLDEANAAAVWITDGLASGFFDPSVADDAVTTAKIANGAVTTAKIADDAITTAKIAAGAVGTTDIADNAITTAKIAAGAVGPTDLADLAVVTAKIENSAVTTDKITDGAVTTGKIGDSAVTNGKASFVWSSYTPSVGSGTLGNGTVSGSHCRMGGLVFFRIVVTIGSTSSAMTNGFTLSLPFTAVTSPATNVSCSKWTGSIGTNDPVVARINTSNNCEVGENTASATNDAIYVSGFYEAA